MKLIRFFVLPATLACALTAHAVSAPVVRYDFEEDPGFLNNSAAPSFELSNDGNVQKLPSGGPGSGQAALLSGANRLMVGDSAEWNSSRFTVECYFRVDEITSSTQVLVCHHNNTGDQRGWHLAVTSGGSLRFYKSSNGSSGESNETGTVVAGRNYYAAALFDSVAGDVTMVLKDLSTGNPGTGVAFSTASGLFDADAPLSVGATGTSTGGTSFFKGQIDSVRFSSGVLISGELLETVSGLPSDPVINSSKADGYQGIWFPLGQRTEFGDKYSGGLATYTVNHSPLAVYCPEVNKTFFTYGGTTDPDEGHLLIMASYYDHEKKTVPKPTIVMDKAAAAGDPHDNGSISVDDSGYVWVFVSGRNTHRKGYTFRSTEPYSTDSFQRISPAGGEDYTYPQIWHEPGQGFAHFFTIYESQRRNLFMRKSADGIDWEPRQALAKVGGSYQISGAHGAKIATFFNRHVNGNVDTRTDLYYLESPDFGETWTLADGTAVTLPITAANSPARVVDYSSQGRLMYNCDLNFDKDGNPVLLYLTTSAFKPGPAGEPRTYHVAHWTGSVWEIHDMPTSATALSTTTHNYDAGSIWVAGDTWTVIAPTGARTDLKDSNPERFWGQGGEIEHWVSTDHGQTWERTRKITENSARNHGFVRRSRHGEGRFQSFWSDGNPDGRTEVHLYFGDSEGKRQWELPYEMDAEEATPVEVDPPYNRWLEQSFNESQLSDPEVTGAGKDPDGDGFDNFREYVYGSDPNSPATRPPQQVLSGGMQENRYQLSYKVNAEAHDVTTFIEACGDLKSWQNAEEDFFDVSRTVDGSQLILQRRDNASMTPENPGRFYRLMQLFD